MYFQQGDVLIKPLPPKKDRYWPGRLDDVEERSQKAVDKLVVAYGEATGHSHVIKGKIINFIPKRRNDPIVFELVEDSVIYHEEHGEIVLPAGTYYIDQVLEYDHFKEESRRVVD